MNKPVLHMTVGLPRSGKSTWAKAAAKKWGAPVVCPDSIRLAMHGQVWLPSMEPLVWWAARVMVESLMLSGHDVVILDATNLRRQHRDVWEDDRWVRNYHVFPTRPEVCEARAFADNRSYLVEVIHRMIRESDGVEVGEAATVWVHAADGTIDSGYTDFFPPIMFLVPTSPSK